MNASETFREVVELIRKGEDISQEELVDACGYAADGVNELYVLLKAFRDGYKHQQESLRRKDQIIQQKIDRIKNQDRTIWVLNRKLQGKGEDGGQIARATGGAVDVGQ